ncbi:MAG TPA: sugar phosphate nucleotidyltransferase [Armatimonadota bacterium]|jgi:UTP--glucose-1-phosphate uridylyltransferase
MPKTTPVTRAVITAAGRGTRQYPATQTLQKEMIPLVDRDGVCKPALQIIVEEAVAAGIERICLVVQPGAEILLQQHFRGLTAEERAAYANKPEVLAQAEKLAALGERISYAVQPTPEGYGHAVYCAREFIGNQPFLLMLGDHVYTSAESRPCARQLLDAFERTGAPLSGVALTPEAELHNFGTVTGTPLAGAEGVWETTAIYEKPTPEYARVHLATSGVPAGQYLCFFGMHVFTPDIFDCLAELITGDQRERGEFQMTSAQELLRRRRRYLAVEVHGRRHDLGVPEGLVETQVALALRSPYGEVVRQACREEEL